MTAAERKRLEREHKRAIGLVPVEVWILPRSKPEIAAIIERDKEEASGT